MLLLGAAEWRLPPRGARAARGGRGAAATRRRLGLPLPAAEVAREAGDAAGDPLGAGAAPPTPAAAAGALGPAAGAPDGGAALHAGPLPRPGRGRGGQRGCGAGRPPAAPRPAAAAQLAGQRLPQRRRHGHELRQPG